MIVMKRKEILVCSHFHRAGVWKDGDYAAINTGSFMKGSNPWLVDVEEDTVARAIEFDERVFQPCDIKGRFQIS